MGKKNGGTVRRVLWVGLGIVALAGVIFAGAALSSPSSKEPAKPSKLSAAIEAERYARDAQAALSNNETSTALTLANRALQLDSGNAAARRVSSSVKSAAAAAARVRSSTAVPVPTTDDEDPEQGDDTPEQGGDAPGQTPPTAPTLDLSEGYTESVKDLAGLLPASVSGWIRGQVVEQAPDALVTLDPAKGASASSMAIRAVVSVHDMGTPAKARDFVTKVSKRTYAKDGAAVKVGVVPDAYFGTNGTSVAAVAFARGRFAFDVVLPVRPGVKPVDTKATVVSIAAAIPASK